MEERGGGRGVWGATIWAGGICQVSGSAVFAMARENVPLAIARKVLRASVTLHRHAELECSEEWYNRDRVPCPGDGREGCDADDCLCRGCGDYTEPSSVSYGLMAGHGTVPRGVVTMARLERRLTALLAPYGVTPVFQGDPRGAVVKLRMPSGRTDDGGQTGLCVPS